ncbi:MAG: acyltransferase [Gloeobacteraceae cyanobacterium ES-bin-316]|nr:acyltransferase [Ferruginibacter sp.]
MKTLNKKTSVVYQKERIYYLDWLRIFAFCVLILFHSWQPFTTFNWLLSSEHKTIAADLFTVFFHTWRLHLIFFVSGVGTWLAIRSRGRYFFNDRFKRLIVPFIFGSIVIVPCQYYYQMLQKGIDITFLDFMIGYPAFLTKQDLQFDLFLWILEIGIHLWYLPYLFITTFISFPLLKRINERGIPNAFMQKLDKQPRLILIFSLPIIVAIIVLKPIFPAYTSVADFFTYFFFFAYGFIFMKEHARLLPIIRANNTILLTLGVMSSLLIINFLLIETLRNAAFNPGYNLNHIIVSIPLGLSAFSWTLYFISLFSRKFNAHGFALAALSRIILPLYIVHQSIIVVAGFYIIKYVHYGLLEFLLIVLVTVIGSILACNLLKMFKTTRFLFGLKN